MRLVDVVYDSDALSYVDFSGFNRTIAKIGSGDWKITPPLTSKTYNAIRVTPTSGLSVAGIPIGKYSHERESFSINMHFKPAYNYSNEYEIFYSSSNGLGLTFKNNKLFFKLKSYDDQEYSIIYNIPIKGDSYHISATYDDRVASLIIDGVSEGSLTLPDSFKFKATSNITFTSSISSGFFLLDRVQVLNEVLPIARHQLELRQDNYLQSPGLVLCKDNPHYFGFDPELKQVEEVLEYGLNKDYSTAIITNLEVDEFGYLVLSDGETQGTLEDYHYFPPLSGEHNQIDWYSDTDNVKFEYSFDGINYSYAYNHWNIPSFTGGYLYYRVTLEKQDSGDYPKLYSLKFTSYSSKKFPSNNSLYELNTNYNYTVGQYAGLLIDHSDSMGIRMLDGGFSIPDTEVRSVEFLYMPESIANPGYLVHCGAAGYSWGISGTVSHAGIENIFVNGKNLTGEDNISTVFTPNMWHHVAITFIANQAGPVYINQNASGSIIGQTSRFAHLAVYDHDIPDDAVIHYKYLTTKVSEASYSDTLSIGSETFSAFGVDKVIVSTQ